MSFDRERYNACANVEAASAGGLEAAPEDVRDAVAFLFAGLAEQRKAIRALAQRVEALEAAQSGDRRYAEAQQDHDDPTALEVW